MMRVFCRLWHFLIGDVELAPGVWCNADVSVRRALIAAERRRIVREVMADLARRDWERRRALVVD